MGNLFLNTSAFSVNELRQTVTLRTLKTITRFGVSDTNNMAAENRTRLQMLTLRSSSVREVTVWWRGVTRMRDIKQASLSAAELGRSTAYLCTTPSSVLKNTTSVTRRTESTTDSTWSTAMWLNLHVHQTHITHAQFPWSTKLYSVKLYSRRRKS